MVSQLNAKSGKRFCYYICKLYIFSRRKRFESEEKTASGIFIPDSAKEKPQEGEVVAVGAGKYLDNTNTIFSD